eukprot:9015405-Alexandrium_andersonii.AAC.1
MWSLFRAAASWNATQPEAHSGRTGPRLGRLTQAGACGACSTRRPPGMPHSPRPTQAGTGPRLGR